MTAVATSKSTPDRPAPPPGRVRFRLDLEYDGTGFLGWQVQPAGRTVQGVVESALGQILSAPVRLVGAGRTDRGCHAARQVAHADAPVGREAAEIARRLAVLLPSDVRILGVEVAPPGVHARFSAKERVYRYRIARRRSVHTRHLAWQLGQRLDLAQLRAASACLIGEHDFRGFAVGGGEEAGSSRALPGLCRVARADWEISGGEYCFTIAADRFLTRMVRLLVGALVLVGRGRLDPRQIAARLDRPPYDPRPAAAPAAGLCLARVRYERGMSR